MTPVHSPAPPRRPFLERLRFELRRREVEVAEVERLSPGFVRVRFAGDDLADFRSLGFDDHVKFFFERNGETLRRDYTPRRFDVAARWLDIEFALHGHGGASQWARQARPGDRAVIGGPRGSVVVASDLDLHLLVGDATALPAIHRRVEELPAAARAIVIVQIDDPADRRTLSSSARIDAHWVPDAATLLGLLRELPGVGDAEFAWGAGEATMMAKLRSVLVDERGLSREITRIAAYWKRGQPEFHERMDA